MPLVQMTLFGKKVAAPLRRTATTHDVVVAEPLERTANALEVVGVDAPDYEQSQVANKAGPC
jgi:hypothetical protein